jgi:hypothetical protein
MVDSKNADGEGERMAQVCRQFQKHYVPQNVKPEVELLT